MPSYTYECEDLHVTEIFCKLSEKKETVDCEECGKEAVQCIKEAAKGHTRGCSDAPTKV